MKKIIISSLILFTSLSVIAQQAGRVKISFAGFKCMRETADDILHLDGKADEVFLRFYFTLADRNGNTKLKYSNQTDLYGDNHGPFGNRINAGSAVDLFGNLKGGIKAGDNYYCNNIIGEYDLAAGDVLTVVPTLWEWDPGNGFETAFDATIDGAYTVMNQKASALSNQRFGTILGTSSTDILGLVLIDAGSFLSLKSFFNIVGELTPKPRPVGITKTGEYSPKAVLLNANAMQQMAGSNFGYGAGVIPVQYSEEALGNSRDHGNYIVLLKVEFTPNPVAATPPAPPPPPRSSGNNAPPPPPPPPSSTANNSKTVSGNFRKMEKPSSGSSISGNWQGTYGNGESNNPNFYSFRLNADGTMQVIAANGNVIANGNYTYTNNQLTGTYTYTNAGAYSFSAIMEASGTLNGTWGSGSNVRGGGRWIMTKK